MITTSFFYGNCRQDFFFFHFFIMNQQQIYMSLMIGDAGRRIVHNELDTASRMMFLFSMGLQAIRGELSQYVDEMVIPETMIT